MIRKYLQGGIVPFSNPTYPMARLQGSIYAAPLNYNQPNEVVGGYDARVNPMTGEEIPQANFAEGGDVDNPLLAGGDPRRFTDIDFYNRMYGNPRLADDSGFRPQVAIEPTPPEERVGTVDDSSRGPTPGQPRINPIDPYHPVPPFASQTGGIGSYMDALNQQFAAGPRYGTRTGIGGGVPWVNPGEVPTYGGGTEGGGGGGGGGIGSLGPGALVIGGKIYQNWDQLKDLYTRLTGGYLDPATKLTKKEAEDATNKTESAAKLETDASIANAGYIVNPLTGLIEGPGVRGGQVLIDEFLGGNTVGLGEKEAAEATDKLVEKLSGTSVDPLLGGNTVGLGEKEAAEATDALANRLNSSIGAFDPTAFANSSEAQEATDELAKRLESKNVPTTSATDFSALASPIAGAAAPGIAGLLTRGSSTSLEDLAGNIYQSGSTSGGLSGAASKLADAFSPARNAAEISATNLGSNLLNTGAGALGSALVGSLAKNDAQRWGSTVGSLAGSFAPAASALGLSNLGWAAGPVGALIGLGLGSIGNSLFNDKPNPLKNPLTGEMVDSGPMYDVLKEFYARPGEVLGVAQKPMSVEETLKLMQDAESGNITNANADQYFGIGAKNMSYTDLIEEYLKNGGDPRAIGSQFAPYMPGKAAEPSAPVSAPAQQSEPYADVTDWNMYGYAAGGLASLPEYRAGGKLLRGPGDGMSDDIKANINGEQEARLADGEFVIPADVVSHLGNGSTEAGSKRLYEMMDKVRMARTGNKKQGKQINPHKFLPV